MTTHAAKTINIYNAPFDGDSIQFPSGQKYTLRQDMNPIGWTLYDGKTPHYLIQRIPSMIGLCRAIIDSAEHESYCTGAACGCRDFTNQMY